MHVTTHANDANHDMSKGPEHIKWKEVASAPVDRVGHIAVLLNNKVYVGGGNEYRGKGSYLIRTYDVANDTWNHSPICVPFCYFALATFKNYLIIAGGFDIRESITNKIFMLENNQLKDYAKLLTPKYAATAVGHNRFLIIVGGVSNEKLLGSTELFDSATGQWHVCGNLPRPHSWLKAVKIKNTLYLLGGCKHSNLDSCAAFYASLDGLAKHQLKWASIQDTPWQLSASASVHGEHLLAIGGGKHIEEDNERIHASEVFMFNKINQNWELIGHLPSARYGPAAVSLDDNNVMVMGGVNAYAPRTDIIWIGTC